MRRLLKVLSKVGLASERGEVNLAGMMMIAVAVIFIAVGFIIYPIIMDGTDGIINYVNADNASCTVDDFTGLGAVAGITPLIALLGFVTAACITGFFGFQSLRGGGGGSMHPKGIMMLGIGQIFIAVMLIIFPVILDAICPLIMGDLSAYTGLEPILQVTPMIVLTLGIIGTIMGQYFGTKALQG